MRFDPERLRAALGLIPPGAWSLPSTFDDTGVHHGYRQVTLVGAGHLRDEAAPFIFVLDELAPVFQSWLSWIEPGGYIVSHRDAGPWRERWQVPIQAAGTFDLDETFRPVDGEAFKVTHWEPHSVTNDTDLPRVHLVLDRDVLLDLPAKPFELFV